MNRRSLIARALAAVSLGNTGISSGSTTCGYAGCRAQVSFPHFAAVYDLQHQSEWCWAASVAMLFGYFGHPISQSSIVRQTYGLVDNIPAMSGAVIAHALNRNWVDDQNAQFSSTVTGVFDAQAGIQAIDNAAVIASLDADLPLIIGAMGHAMVLTLVSYNKTQFGPNITEMGVFDPWPGRGARDLTPIEMVPPPTGGLIFLASVEIS